MVKKKNTIYFDMDGVLADFDKACKKLNHLYDMPWLDVENFFRNLEPIGEPNKPIELLISLGYEVYILSKVELRDEAGKERAIAKQEWVKEHIPCLPSENVIIVPIHHCKTDYLKSPIGTSILIDDYKGNLNDWKQCGGIAVKFGKVWKNERPYYQILENIFHVIPLVESLEKAL